MDNYRDRGIKFIFTEMKGPVRDLVAKAGWGEKYVMKIQYPSIQHALQAIRLMTEKKGV